MTGHLLIIDASGFAHRAFHSGASPVHRFKDGQPLGAALGFMGLVWRLLGTVQSDRPTHGAAIFDAPGKTFRHRLAPDYKANRPIARSMELADQIPIMHHAAETLGLKPIEAAGYEADDILATLATRARAAGMRVSLVTSDKDLGQCVEDGWIEIWDPMAQIKDANGNVVGKGRRLFAADVEAKFGVPPALVPHVQALWGDSVDNIIGVDGVGKDKAARLVRRYGSVEGILKAVKEIRWAHVRLELLKKPVQERVRLNLKLATLRRNVKLPVELDELLLEPIMRSHLTEILRVLGAPHYMEAIFALDPQMARTVPPEANPEGWWREELAHPGQTVPEAPQSGFYWRRLVGGGPLVGARIWREPHMDTETGEASGMDILRCDVGGRPHDPFAAWPGLANRPIMQSEYDFMAAKASHAKKWLPDSAAANPGKAINLRAEPLSLNPRRRAK